MRRFRVLIADDHTLLAEGLATLLRPHYDVVGFAANGRETIDEVNRLRPDLVTLDIGMPVLNGLEAARELRKQFPRLKLVFVTQMVELRYLKAALRAGADAFVAKQSASREVLIAAEQALAGKRYITPLLEEAFAAATLAEETSGTELLPDPLTPRQRQVLQLIAEGHSSKSIGKTLNISSKTVEFHKEATLRTLGLKTTAELIRYAVSVGVVGS